MPWNAIAILASVLLPMLLKGKEQGALGKGYQTPTIVDTTSTQSPTSSTVNTTQSPTGYQSPMLGLADPLGFEMLLKNMGAYSNWGGKNISSPWISEILKMMGGSTWPALLEGYKNPQTTPAAPAAPTA